MTADEFCEKLIGPEPNCFSGRVPMHVDTDCKCADHKCHVLGRSEDDLAAEALAEKEQNAKKGPGKPYAS